MDFPNDNHITRPQLFDPSLRHFRRAFRQGDPLFGDDHVAELRWHTARRTVMDGLLQLIAESTWCEHLALRGSRLMQLWFPKEARVPGDLDWVVVPASLQLNHRGARDLLDGITDVIHSTATVNDIVIDVTNIKCDQIWSYERAPGIRFVIPWKAEGTPVGSVQMDLVFGERLFADVLVESMSLFDGTATRLNVVSPELSLAWKVQWLLCDMSPQGKDLYDAVLLAETVPLSIDMLKAVVVHVDPWWKERVPTLHDIEQLDVDWEPFLIEHPWVNGDQVEWRSRLVKAIAPSFQR